MEKTIEDLLKKAGEAASSVEALQLTQAALNAANALRVVQDTQQGRGER